MRNSTKSFIALVGLGLVAGCSGQDVSDAADATVDAAGSAVETVGDAASATVDAASDATGAVVEVFTGPGDVVDVAIGAGDFTTLVAAVQAAGLVETLKGEGPFTVFAPTDAAFAELEAGTVENLLLEENRDQLVAILTYHVVPGKIMAADLSGAEITATTVQGGELEINGLAGVRVNDATVINADVEASNGVIHVIDSVLLP